MELKICGVIVVVLFSIMVFANIAHRFNRRNKALSRASQLHLSQTSRLQLLKIPGVIDDIYDMEVNQQRPYLGLDLESDLESLESDLESSEPDPEPSEPDPEPEITTIQPLIRNKGLRLFLLAIVFLIHCFVVICSFLFMILLFLLGCPMEGLIYAIVLRVAWKNSKEIMQNMERLYHS